MDMFFIVLLLVVGLSIFTYFSDPEATDGIRSERNTYS